MAVAGSVGYFATRPAGNSTTDTSAENTAKCLAKYPVPDTAARFAARAHDIYSGCGGSEVLEATDIGNRLVQTEEPSARLILRIDMPGHRSTSGEQDPVTACYRVEFDYFGLDNGPDRVNCPPDADRPGIPDGYADAFTDVLLELPPAPTRDEVLAALRAKLPPVPVDEKTGTTWPEPALDAYVSNGEIGISADARRGRCLEGSRLADGIVTVGRVPPPPKSQSVMACTAENAVR